MRLNQEVIRCFWRRIGKIPVFFVKPVPRLRLPIRHTLSFRETRIMFRDDVRLGIRQVGVALRDPEAFAVAWAEGWAMAPLDALQYAQDAMGAG